MKQSRPDLLSRPLFILALGLLLLNDFYLKHEFSNFLTGKLSDIAGLFLFPYFLSSLRIKWTKTIYWITAFLFLFWKSPFSQDLINWSQAIGIGFNRVIDYSDLLALLVLPLSLRYFQKQLLTERRINKYLTAPLGIITLFAIWATSLQREEVELNLKMNDVYELKMSKTDFFNSINAKYGYHKNLNDSLFYLHFVIVDESRIDLSVLSTITSVDSKTTKVRLDEILYGTMTGGLFSGVDKDDVEHFKSISAEEFKAHFEKYFIQPIEKGRAKDIYIENKKTQYPMGINE